jgi:iron complex outermembrane receptor protein
LENNTYGISLKGWLQTGRRETLMTSSKTITVELRPNSTTVRAGLFAGCAAVAILATPGAIAQEAGPQAQEASSVDRVVVTGSRLRGVEDPVGSPVLAIGRDDIELASVTTVDKIIQQTPQIFDLGVSEGSRAQNGGSGNIVYGTGINLRGLGPYATLVLVDGHRAISNGRSVDPSFLPSLGLERVEVLADGASMADSSSPATAQAMNMTRSRLAYPGAKPGIQARSTLLTNITSAAISAVMIAPSSPPTSAAMAETITA